MTFLRAWISNPAALAGLGTQSAFPVSHSAVGELVGPAM